MNELPTFRRCVYASAALLILYATLFIGVERPILFRLFLILGGIFMVFPVDQFMRLLRMTLNVRPKQMDYVFAAALDPSEGHHEPDDYTLIGVITEVRKLTNEES